MAVGRTVKRTPEWREMLKRSLIRSGALIGAITLMLGTLFLALALLSYAPSDPSMNTVAGDHVANIMASPGAWAADFLLWLLGVPVALILPLMAVTARRLWGDQDMRGWMAQFGKCLVGIILVGIALALFQTDPLVGLPAGWGGVIGLVTAKGIASLAAQAQAMRTIVEAQVMRIGGWMQQLGVTTTPEDLKGLAQQAMSSMGRVTAAVGTAVGAITSAVMMLVLGIFIATEPQLYERGVAWMLPMEKRRHFYQVAQKMGWTLRRLMFGRIIVMSVEGVGTWLLLWVGGVPMAGLLGILTGLLAFLPNIGAIVSGVLIVLVGFSGGTDTGLYAVGVYLAVQIIDGYLIVPMVAKRAVDLAPALVLAAQILFGALFGIIGLFLADPIVAMIKVYLEERSKALKARNDARLMRPADS